VSSWGGGGKGEGGLVVTVHKGPNCITSLSFYPRPLSLAPPFLPPPPCLNPSASLQCDGYKCTWPSLPGSPAARGPLAPLLLLLLLCLPFLLRELTEPSGFRQ
jgi:hypothetical protein